MQITFQSHIVSAQASASKGSHVHEIENGQIFEIFDIYQYTMLQYDKFFYIAMWLEKRQRQGGLCVPSALNPAGLHCTVCCLYSRMPLCPKLPCVLENQVRDSHFIQSVCASLCPWMWHRRSRQILDKNHLLVCIVPI